MFRNFLRHVIHLMHYICVYYTMIPHLVCTRGIRISNSRLNDFMANKLDLRQIYLNPEIKGEYFDISYQDNVFYKTRLMDSV